MQYPIVWDIERINRPTGRAIWRRHCGFAFLCLEVRNHIVPCHTYWWTATSVINNILNTHLNLCEVIGTAVNIWPINKQIYEQVNKWNNFPFKKKRNIKEPDSKDRQLQLSSVRMEYSKLRMLWFKRELVRVCYPAKILNSCYSLLTNKSNPNIRNMMIATQLVSTVDNKYFLFWRLTNNIYSNTYGFA